MHIRYRIKEEIGVGFGDHLYTRAPCSSTLRTRPSGNLQMWWPLISPVA